MKNNLIKIILFLIIFIGLVFCTSVRAVNIPEIETIGYSDEYKEYMSLSDEEKSKRVEPSRYNVFAPKTNSEYLNNEFEYEKKDILQKQSKKGIQELVLCVVIAYLISAMFGNSMYYTSPYFFIFLGWLMKDNIIDNSKENKSNFTKFKLNHKKLINVKKEVSQNEYRN